jgi:hypothetical protein
MSSEEMTPEDRAALEQLRERLARDARKDRRDELEAIRARSRREGYFPRAPRD